jgi:C1A family cysteine protease
MPLSPGGHVFNRKVPAPLPIHMMLSRTVNSITLQQVVDLREWMGPLKNQLAEGSCTGHAGTECVEWMDRKYYKNENVFSPQYTYAKELIANGDFPQDNGSDGTTLCETTIQCGVCELSLYPYVQGQITMPTAAQDANAAKHKMTAYHGVGSSAIALSVLGDKTPWPLAIGFNVPASFESQQVSNTGVMLPFKPGEQSIGGHEVAATCGYDIGAVPTLRPQGCPPALLIQNSWGSGWGWKGLGLFWMPLTVVDASDTDIKVFHPGKWN